MSTQPEALRLADDVALNHTFCPVEVLQAAAAELRRLHKENERLHQINQSHEMKLSVRGYEIQIADLEAQRDALLEALKLAWPIIEAEKYKQDCSYGKNFVQTKADRARSVYDKARAAIEAVEGEKK